MRDSTRSSISFPTTTTATSSAGSCADHRLTQVLHNLPGGNWAAGERGIACLPDRVDEFKAGVDKAIDYATALECGRVNCLAGIPPPGDARRDRGRDLRAKCRLCGNEPEGCWHQTDDRADQHARRAGFFLNTTRQALDVIAAVGSDNVFVQYDIYHMQIMEGNLASTIEKHLPSIGHMQLADVPGRHEPGTGEIDFRRPLRRDRSRWLHGVDRLRVHPTRGNRRRPSLGRALPELTRSPLDRLRRICLALPGAWEKVSDGEPTFWLARGCSASFADASNHHGAGRLCGVVQSDTRDAGPARLAVTGALFRSAVRRAERLGRRLSGSLAGLGRSIGKTSARTRAGSGWTASPQ